MSDRFRRWYGAGPAHLVAVGAGLAVSVYAAWRLVPRDPQGVGVWIVGAALVHDLVLVPAYTIVFLAVVALVGRGRGALVLNHLRVPALLSGLLLLVFLPLILRRPPNYAGITDYGTDPYVGRWLGLTVGLYAASALVYVAGWARRRRARV